MQYLLWTHAWVLRILVVFQDRLMFSHMIQKASASAFHWCGWTRTTQVRTTPVIVSDPKQVIAPRTGVLFTVLPSSKMLIARKWKYLHTNWCKSSYFRSTALWVRESCGFGSQTWHGKQGERLFLSANRLLRSENKRGGWDHLSVWGPRGVKTI